MVTTIKFKRGTGKERNAVSQLKDGEPYYDLETNHLYVGSKAHSSDIAKRHVSEITKIEDENGKVTGFQVGEDVENKIDMTDITPVWKKISDLIGEE